MIDLRSDTVTKPTPAMLEAMWRAEVGDDVFEEDPTVAQLEEKAAALFQKEAALFCPSGTMSNQIAIKILTEPTNEILCDKSSHIYCYEGGGFAFNSGCSIRLLDGDRGRLKAQDIAENVNADDKHLPETKLVVLENTHSKGGGSFYRLETISEISAVSRQHGLRLHLDGARIFNALAKTGDSAAEIAAGFDTISFCLSKGLGAPVGSLLLSSKTNHRKARRIRKTLGGGMRQAGFLAAAGIYALDHHIDRLKEDHRRAFELGKALSSLAYVERLLPVETNIVVFTLAADVEVPIFLGYLADHGIKGVQFGKNHDPTGHTLEHR